MITIQTRRVTRVRVGRQTVIGRCEECEAEVRMVTAEQAAALAGATLRAIYRRVEAAELHYLETEDGHLLICANSF